MYERFTDRARQIVDSAYEEAAKMGHEYVGTEHLLLALIAETQGIAGNVLRELGLTQSELRADALKIVPMGSGPTSRNEIPLTPHLKQVLDNAKDARKPLQHNYVGTEHLLIGLVQDRDGLGAQILLNRGLSLEKVRDEVLQLLGHDPEELDSAFETTKAVLTSNNTLRILDAAANRATEGLRVVEDFTRFVLDDVYLTRLLKELRHDLAEALTALPREDRHFMRETQHDVGTTISTVTESQRTDAWAVCEASCERVKQSLRSLEEFSKTISPEVASKFESLRYRFYTLEKALTTRLRFRDELGAAKLCVLVDGSFSVEKVRQLFDAGLEMIQLRDKNLSDRELLERARTLCEIAKEPGRDGPYRDDRAVLVIVNDRPDIAAAANADGVHLGQEDLPVKEAREILGPRKLIGVSTHDIEQARQAVLDGANYIGVGPTFPSATKEFGAFRGTAFLKQVADEISLPAFAIGGITLENLPKVLASGIKRVAVGGAITKADDPGKVAGEFVRLLQ